MSQLSETPPPPRDLTTRRARLAQGIKSKLDAGARSGASRFKRFAAKLWQSRGGGLYGFGYMLTFIWLEIQLLVSEFGEASGVVEFVTTQFAERFFRVAIESFFNSVLALAWPFLVVNEYELFGIALIGAGALLYKRFVHERIAALLEVERLEEAEPTSAEAKADSERG